MKTLLLFLALIVAIIWVNEYSISVMPEEVKVAYYKEKEKEAAQSREKWEQFVAFINLPYKEVPDGKRLEWLVINFGTIVISLGIFWALFSTLVKRVH